MRFKIFYLFALICASFSAISAKKYDQISDCYFHNMGLVYGGDTITFICAEQSENEVFIQQSKFHCSNNDMDLSNMWPGDVNFKNCKFPKIKKNFFELFPMLHKFNVTDVDLETLPLDLLRSAKNLTRFLAPQNHLKEIPALAFVLTNKVRLIDFSNNIIQKVDQLAFGGATSLESLDLSQNLLSEFGEDVLKPLTNLRMLNLSNNQIKKFDFQFLNAPNLVELDLSNNSISVLNDHSFDNMSNLAILDMAFNPIGNLKPDIFLFLTNLQKLNLRRTNLTNIESGTFSHQHNLVTLDLSENQLKKIDFMLFFPIMYDLKTLQLGGNQLTDFDGFDNKFFPKLNLLDIKNNAFNCSYLKYFMTTVDWTHIRLSLDPKAVNLREPNIRGVKCTGNANMDYLKDLDKTGAKTAAYINYIHSDNGSGSGSGSAMHIMLVFMCIIMTLFFVIFVVMYRDKIYSQFRRFTIPYHPNQSSDLEYSNDNF